MNPTLTVVHDMSYPYKIVKSLGLQVNVNMKETVTSIVTVVQASGGIGGRTHHFEVKKKFYLK